jgi:hypothetical protein
MERVKWRIPVTIARAGSVSIGVVPCWGCHSPEGQRQQKHGGTQSNGPHNEIADICFVVALVPPRSTGARHDASREKIRVGHEAIDTCELAHNVHHGDHAQVGVDVLRSWRVLKRLIDGSC